MSSHTDIRIYIITRSCRYTIKLRQLLRRLQRKYAFSRLDSDRIAFKACRSLYKNKLLSTKSSYLLAFSESAFSVIAPKSWNYLPYDIRCVTSIALFKRKLYVHFKSLQFVLFYFIIRSLFIFVFVFYYLTTPITTQCF